MHHAALCTHVKHLWALFVSQASYLITPALMTFCGVLRIPVSTHTSRLNAQDHAHLKFQPDVVLTFLASFFCQELESTY